jgi:hypothetical protein
MECMADNFNGNCGQPVCEAESDAYLACFDAETCEGYSCSQDATSCTCTGECKKQSLEQVCLFSDGGMNIPCDCYADGTFIGSCTMNGDACAVPTGCCMALL